MLDCAPAEEDFVGLDVDFVEQAVLYPAVFRAADGGEVELGDVHGCYEDGAV